MKMPRPKTLLLISACTAVLTIILKMGAWYVTGSVGLLSDGLESFVNLAGAVFALLMVTIAERPADADHPHGHHKAEYFSSGFEGVLIFAAALGILWTAIDRLFHPQPLEQVGWGLCSLQPQPACTTAHGEEMLRKYCSGKSCQVDTACQASNNKAGSTQGNTACTTRVCNRFTGRLCVFAKPVNKVCFDSAMMLSP